MKASLCVLISAIFVCSSTQEQRLKDLPLPSEPCLHGGIMVQNECKCTLRYEGDRCEREKCLNGGRRYMSKGKEVCRCPNGLSGKHCELVTRCEEGRGTLKNGKCVCNKGYSGLFCQEKPCHHGIPNGAPEEDLCLCEIGYTGPFCEEKLICENGGRVNADNECTCARGYAGLSCESCAAGYIREAFSCIPQVSESSLLAQSGSTRPLAWTLAATAGAAAIVLLGIVLIAVMAFRKWSSKPSRVNSVQGDREGTDV